MLTVILGATTSVLEELEEVEARRAALAAEIEDKEKDIAYLSAMEETLGYTEKLQLDDLRQGIKAQKMQLANLGRRAAVLARKRQDYSKCYLRAQTLHPPLQLIIGDMAAELRETLENVVVRRQEHEIAVDDDSGDMKRKALREALGRRE